jgi:hypothetical protein
MLKSTALLAMVGLFLAFTLIWTVPGFAQAQDGQGGMCPRGYGQGYGPGGGYGPGYCANPQNPQYGPGYCNGQGRRNRARWNNNLQNPQAPANPNPEPQSQTPGGGPAPQSGN